MVHLFKRTLLARKNNSLVSLTHFSSWSSYPPVKLFCRVLDGVESKNTPIIVLHGMLGNSLNWLSLARTIQKKTGRTVLLPDARNHGDSPRHDDMSYYHMAADLRELIRDKAENKATLIGHSMGGRTAMTLSLLEPSIVDRLLIVDSSPTHPTTKQGQELMHTFLKALNAVDFESKLFQTSPGKAKILADNVLHKNGIKQKEMRQWLLMNMVQENDKYRWLLNLKPFSKSFPDQLVLVPPELVAKETFSNRTLFVCGQRSGYIKEESHQGIKKVFTQAKFIYVKGAGHWVQVDNPRHFIRTTVAFVLQE